MLEIKLIEKEDAYEYARVSSKCWLESYPGIIDQEFLDLINTEEELQKQKERILEHFDDKSFRYILKDNNKSAGIFRIRETKYDKYKDAIELGALYLLDEFKGKGYGKEIWNFVINKAKSLGYNKLVIGCLEKNPTNEFYKHMGGKLVSTNPITINNKEYIENIYYYDL